MQKERLNEFDDLQFCESKSLQEKSPPDLIQNKLDESSDSSIFDDKQKAKTLYVNEEEKQNETAKSNQETPILEDLVPTDLPVLTKNVSGQSNSARSPFSPIVYDLDE